MAAPRRWSLLNLPLLVLVGIAEALCPHCTEDPKFHESDPPIHFGGGPELLSRTRDLANLAATCKDLHYIVLPILYHQAQCHPHRRIQLLRTLARRPDLARRVKVLKLDFPGELSEDSDDLDFVLELAARHGWPYAVDPKMELEDRFGLEAIEGERATEDMPINLLLVLCTNLEKLTTDIRDFYKFDFLQPSELPHLKSVFITASDASSYIDLGDLCGLYHAAPSLEAFTAGLLEWGGDEPLPLANLRHIALEMSAISPGCLNALLKSCPQLESFTYFMGGTHAIEIARITKSLFRYVPKIKHLDLHIAFEEDEDAEYDSDWFVDWDDHCPKPAPGFASFSHLETLVLYGPELLDIWIGYGPPAALFPQSLRSLGLILGNSPPEVAGVELEPFVRTARSILPNLTSVTSRGYTYGPSTEHLKVS